MSLKKEHFTHPVSVTCIAMLVLVGATFAYQSFVSAATYTFTQKTTGLGGGGWTTLDASTVATHDSNQSGWSKYTATSSTSVLAGAAGVSLLSTSRSIADDGFASTTFASTGGYSTGFCNNAVTADSVGNLYVANDSVYGSSYNGNTVSKVTPSGTVTTFATVGAGPCALAFDTLGNLYTANYTANTVSKITPAGSVTTFASLGAGSNPVALAFDTSGNLYTANYTANKVSKITPAGVVTDFATTATGLGSGPRSLAFDASGNLYTANWIGGTVSKITPSGTVTTFATVAGADSLAFDTSGNLYVLSWTNSNISKVTPAGSATTFATVGAYPLSIASDFGGNFYTTNWGASGVGTTVSKITSSGTVTTFATVNSGPASMVFNSGILYVLSQKNSATLTSVSKLLVDGGFEGGTKSSTRVIGTGAGAGVVLTPISFSTWNSSDKGAGTTLSNGNLTATAPNFASGGTVRSTIGESSGKWYWEVTIGSNNTENEVGIGLSTASLSSPGDITGTGWWSYYANNGNKYNNSGTSAAYGATFGVGSVIGVALDMDGKTVTMYKNGVSQGTMASGLSANTFYAAWGNGGASSAGATANFGATPFVYSVPSGYNYGLHSGTYATSGTFTSAVVDLGAKADFTGKTLSYSTTAGGNGTVTVKVKAGNTAAPDSSWTNSNSFVTVANNGSLSAFTGYRYIQYQADLTGDGTGTPSLDSVTINYNQYPTSGDLTSSVYNTGNSANLISRLTWTATGTTTDEIVKFQVRSAPDNGSGAPGTWSAWCGYADCSGSTYFTDGPSGGNDVDLATNHSLRSGGDDKYFQYKVFLVSSGDLTPTLTSVAIKYVVNAPPDFQADPTVSQISDSTSSNYGKVVISYSVRDTDTTSGTTNPGYVTPSFEYSTNSGSSWTAIPSGDLQAANITNKAVNGSTYTAYTAVWTASSTLPSTYNATTKVRVTVNDNEAANNTALASTTVMTLDTAAPAVYAILDSSTGDAASATVKLTITDNNQNQYRLCNDSAFPTTDAQGNSCAWSTLGGNRASTTVAWIPTGEPSTETVYIQVRDTYGNVNTSKTSTVAPIAPTNLLIADISNPTASSYGETLSWLSVNGAVSYNIYSAYTATADTAPSSYTYLTNVVGTNVYTHQITTATTSAYWYRVAAINSNGDISNFTDLQTAGDVPDSFGSSKPDTTAPVISSITVPAGTLKSTSAIVTFTTDEIATSSVRFGTSRDATCGYNSAGGRAVYTSGTYVTAQSISLTNLVPNTTYYYCVNAADVARNTSALTDGGSFTTASGPVITSVTATNLTGESATIEWNTSTAADSYVYYSTSSSLTSALTKGTATAVSTATSPGVYHHQVGLTGLSAGTRYYYYVKSTDADANTSTDDNSTLYYNFITTTDTTAPTISAIQTPVLSETAAVIVWQTDEPATTQVTWGTTSGNLTRTTVLDSTKSVYHIVTLSSETSDTTGATQALTASTRFFYRVFSTDASGNQASSTEQNFVSAASGNVTVFSVSPSTGTGTNSTEAPKILSVSAENVKPFSAEIRVSTDKDTVASVQYGESTAYNLTASERSFAFSPSKSIPLNNLQEGTTYHYLVQVVDKSGNITASDDKTFETTFAAEELNNLTTLNSAAAVQNKIQQLIESSLPSLAPPFITKPVVSNITENSASIAWNTNVKTMATLRYATDAEYRITSEYKTEVGADPVDSMATAHTVDLAALAPNTLYHIQARSYVFPQVVGTSPDITFSTKAAAITPNIVAVKNNGFTVVWQTDEPTTSTVSYRNQKTGESGVITSEAQETYHNIEIQNLPSGATYSVSVSGINANGNTLSSNTPATVTTSVDTTPPVISNFKVDNALIPGRTDLVQTVVGWRTDKLANSAVYYQEGASASASSTAGEVKVESLDTYTTSHVMILPSLKSGTVYRVRTVSTDQSGNSKTFGPTSIITPQQTQSVLDIIVKNFESTFKFLGAGN